MRVVADTNTVVSGLLWHGPPRRVLDSARAGIVDLFTTAVLLAELEDVLGREKFIERLARVALTPRDLVFGYAALARLIEPAAIDPTVLADPDDDAVLACAVAAGAEAIVSGDSHLLNLKGFQGVPILNATDLLARISS